MAVDDENVELWSDGTPQAPPPTAPPRPADGPPPPYAPPPASGLPLWAILVGGLVLVALAGVLALVVIRNMSAKTAPTQVASSATSAGPAAVAASAAPVPASAPATPGDAAAQFGLPGVWAVDCSQPASSSNAHETFVATSDGALSDTIDSGPLITTHQYRWDAGRLSGDDQIALDGVFLGDGSAMHVVLQKAGDGRMHVLQAINGVGKQQVVDGAFPGGGAPPWISKCSAG